MSRRRAPLALAAAAASLALAGCRGTPSSRPPIHLNENMDQQQRLDPQEPSPLFPDGRAMRPRVEGTVPVAGWGADDERALTGKDGEQFAMDLPKAVTLDRAFLERGRGRYDIYCAPCHGAAGEGNGTVVARGMAPPPSFHDDRLRAAALGQLYDVITNGVRNMPPYAAQIPPDDRWAVAAYVRVLQRSHMAGLEQVPADVASQKGWK